MRERILELEHHPGEEIVLRLRPPKLDFLPASSRNHVRAAEKEILLAFRDLVDAAIEALERREKAARKKRTTIEVQ